MIIGVGVDKVSPIVSALMVVLPTAVTLGLGVDKVRFWLDGDAPSPMMVDELCKLKVKPTDSGST